MQPKHLPLGGDRDESQPPQLLLMSSQLLSSTKIENFLSSSQPENQKYGSENIQLNDGLGSYSFLYKILKIVMSNTQNWF